MKSACYINLPVIENGHNLAVRKLHENASFKVMHITLKPAERVEIHTTPVDVLFYVLEGTCVVQVGDEKGQFSKDTLIDSPANIPHALYNESYTQVRVMVVKAVR